MVILILHFIEYFFCKVSAGCSNQLSTPTARSAFVLTDGDLILLAQSKSNISNETENRRYTDKNHNNYTVTKQ